MTRRVVFMVVDPVAVASRRARMDAAGAQSLREADELTVAETVLAALGSGVVQPMSMQEVVHKLGQQPLNWATNT